MEFQSYKTEYLERLIEIFRSNSPKYFDPQDETDFIDFLNNYADENYLVVLNHNKIIGCGGHYTKNQTHGIAWVMFERNAIGPNSILKVADEFYFKIESLIKAEKKGYPILVNTTQLMERLFNRYGFKTYETIQNGFGEGLHEYKMKKD